MTGKIKVDKIVYGYHDSMDWLIRKNMGKFWHQAVDREVWKSGRSTGHGGARR